MKTAKLTLRVERNNEVRRHEVTITVDDNGIGEVDFNGKKAPCEVSENTMSQINWGIWNKITCTASNKIINGRSVIGINIYHVI